MGGNLTILAGGKTVEQLGLRKDYRDSTLMMCTTPRGVLWISSDRDHRGIFLVRKIWESIFGGRDFLGHSKQSEDLS